MAKITLPYNFTPRKYQVPLLHAMDSGYQRAVIVWHRRSGKEKTCVNLVAKKMYERVGTYYYLFPTYAQGKKILWRGMDREGFKFTDHFPKELRKSTNNSEMMIEMENGSVFQVVGTDKIDAVVGTNPVGCVFSEYALQDPAAWDFLRPILAENGGWAVFNFTPRGDNHGKDLFGLAEANPDDWFCQRLTVDATGCISKEILEKEKAEIVRLTGDDSLFLQEYYCSFDSPVQGAYYGTQMKALASKGRIGSVPYDPELLVTTSWDLGIGDSTAIWFSQFVANEVRLIDYYEASGEGLAHYAKVLQDKPYLYDRHIAPHDIKVKELGTGKSRLEVAAGLGIRFEVLSQASIDDGIDAGRRLLPLCWIDRANCERGIQCLKNYHKQYDERNKVYHNRPHHDWSSHGADSFRYLSMGHHPRQEKLSRPEKGDSKTITHGVSTMQF